MSRLVDAARAYNGVRFRHRGRKPTGLDCAGLVWLAYADCGLVLPDFRLYGHEPHNDGLNQHVATALGDPVHVSPVVMTDLQPGDVVVVRFVTEPHHMGIVGSRLYDRNPTLTLIHADGWAPPAVGSTKPGKVHETRLIPEQVKLITHVYRRPV